MGVFDLLEWFVGGREGEGRSERVVVVVDCPPVS